MKKWILCFFQILAINEEGFDVDDGLNMSDTNNNTSQIKELGSTDKNLAKRQVQKW